MLGVFLFGLLQVNAQDECKDENNIPFIGVNPDCNWAGACIEKECYCCVIDEKTLKPERYGPGAGIPDCPGWGGGAYDDGEQGPCTSQTEYVSLTAKYYFPASENFDCNNDGLKTSVANNFQDFYRSHEYKGILVPVDCRACTGGSPCRFCSLSNANDCDDYTDGVELSIGTDYHTYYDLNCERPDDPVPSIYNPDRCPANTDKGHIAYLSFKRAKYFNAGAPNEWNSDGTSDFVAVNAALSLGITASAFQVILNNKKVSIREPNICFDRGITNKPGDLKYMGNAEDCRKGIKRTWTGGKTCESPYIVCLPEENTPNMSPKSPNFDTTHRYSVAECTDECAWDQRCRGFEFVADAGKKVGDCNLIDDLPLEMDEPGSYTYSTADEDLSTSGTGKPALCFQKEDYCNPFFEAEQLDQTMIDCYCPNNRKGFYTKKVKRTVPNTKFCDEDAAVDMRIQQAQANRMFHLCENWCLFNTFKPEQESWYWDPWKTCWREQYAGSGTHRSYCNRVIRNPDTIEQYFINYRRDNFCAPRTPMPTGAPVDFTGSWKWFLGETEESCDDVCDKEGRVCAEEETRSLGETSSEQEITDAFQEAGYTCTKFGVAEPHWAGPYMKVTSGMCYSRNSITETNTGCNWAVGRGYKRLCACAESS